MNYILLAIPFFFLLIAIELFVDRYRGTGFYRINDAVTSLNVGIVSRVNGIFRQLLPLTMYVLMEQHFALFELGSSIYVWILAFVLYDFCYYWLHRMGHEINILWAAHVIHHSSEEYNLSTALRQTSVSLVSWIFYLPLALLGIDVVMLIAVGSLNLLYQFWVHTRHIGKLGWYEKVFVTPSNHRVHHAVNKIYLDRNYGGVFILWDRMFGTFQEELESEPCIFGIRKPLASWNPIWTNAHYYALLIKDAVRANAWWDKIRIWFMPTGWRPADVAEKYPFEKFDPDTFEKFEVKIPAFNAWYALAQHLCLLVTTYLLMANIELISTSEKLLWGSYIVFSAISISAILSAKRYAVWLEYSRHILLSGLVIWLGYNQNYLSAAIAASMIGLVLCLILKPANKVKELVS